MRTRQPQRPQKGGNDRVAIQRLPSGVPGLDEILGGGLPEYSFNIIAGAPGCGKTTLAHQIVFANTTPARPSLYFTVLGEPAIKMLRYQQQFTFFDRAKLDGALRFVNLSQIVLEKDLGCGYAGAGRAGGGSRCLVQPAGWRRRARHESVPGLCRVTNRRRTVRLGGRP